MSRLTTIPRPHGGRARAAVSFPDPNDISSIAYCAFLAGPPLIGVLAQRFTLLHALTVVIALLLLAVAISGAVRNR